MRLKNIFKTVTMMTILTSVISSCSKEEVIQQQENEKIILNASAIQAFGEDIPESRTSFEIPEVSTDLTPKVKWVIGDKIYIGSIKDIEDGKTLKELIDNGEFTTFECIEVNETTNVATFEGTSINNDADIAVYSQIPDKVIKATKVKNGTEYYPALTCSVNEVPISDDLSHLAKNDLLVSTFDVTDKKLNFGRYFGLAKFEFTFPTEVEGIGVFYCDELRLTTRVFYQIVEGYLNVDNINASKLRIENINIKGNKITFYSFIVRLDINANTPVTYNIEIGDKRYSATKSYTDKMSIKGTSAFNIKADLKEISQ